MYFCWFFVFRGYSVVYELRRENVVYCWDSAKMKVTLTSCPASVATHPQLRSHATIFIFDAFTGSRHNAPPMTDAFKIVCASNNDQHYRAYVEAGLCCMFAVPSYGVSELLRVKQYFGVETDAILARCLEVGPSLRYVMSADYINVRNRQRLLAANIPAASLPIYMSSTSQFDGGVTVYGRSSDVPASLLRLVVNESEHHNKVDAYRMENVYWYFCSREITAALVSAQFSDARSFIRRFVTLACENDDEPGVKKLMGLAGNMLELIAHEKIAEGNFSFRRLRRDGKQARLADEYIPSRLELLEVQFPSGYSEPDKGAFEECNNAKVLYCFYGSFTGLDMVSNAWKDVYQVTVSIQHTINFAAIARICEFVRNRSAFPAEPDPVNLYFVVPKDLASKWNHERSFALGKSTCCFGDLTSEQQVQVGNLIQYVVYWE
jgi:hypothetical protein